MLEQERAFYDEHLADWLTRYPGRFVLIKGREFCGAFDTLEDALAEGARRFGLASFLARRVEPAQAEAWAPALTLGLLHADSPPPVFGSDPSAER
ncbi:MAG TPA: hypothetical protein VFW96_14885 [Thermomicrobiales bacterium]|nr:hypothetical protein [Thermomicrobiales bacterium]